MGKDRRRLLWGIRRRGAPGADVRPAARAASARFALAGLSLVLLSVFDPGPTFAASPGLPFTEDFSDTTLQDTSLTNANWTPEEQAVVLAWRKKFFETPDSGTVIGSSDLHATTIIASKIGTVPTEARIGRKRDRLRFSGRRTARSTQSYIVSTAGSSEGL